LSAIGVGVLMTLGGSLVWGEPAEEHATLLEWIRAEKLVAGERAEWRREKAVLEGMIALLEKESARLEAELEFFKNEAAKAAADEEALNARAEAAANERSQLKDALGQIGPRLVSLRELLPNPLREEWSPAPAEEGNDNPFQAAHDWLDALRAAEAFDQRVTVARNQVRLPDGKVWEVQEIYFGLAGGYWVTRDGSKAGTIQASGTNDQLDASDLASAVSRMIAIATQREPAKVVRAPVNLD